MTQFVVPLDSPLAADPDRFGPKAANQARLGHIGLPTPGGFCLGADAYQYQIKELGLADKQRELDLSDYEVARKLTNEIRLGLYTQPIAPVIREEILQARKELVEKTGDLIVVRSSALIEDREGTSFAGQFESFLGLENEEQFLTTVAACWAALWSPRALRYMDGHTLNPADTSMAILVQPLVDAIASGGGISKTAEGGSSVSATWGLGEAIAQGEVVPDRYDMNADGVIIDKVAGWKDHSIKCVHHHSAPSNHAHGAEMASKHCLNEEQVLELGKMMERSEELMGGPVEVEWAMDKIGIKMLQARPLNIAPVTVPDEIWKRRPGLRGHPGGIGWATGKACVINCECELGRVGPGDVLVTTVAGPALSQILPRVAGVVAELGGSTSHLASLARERGIPMVLGVMDATNKIPDGGLVAVDGVAGMVRWTA
jgi:pyruvate,water dikinase